MMTPKKQSTTSDNISIINDNSLNYLEYTTVSPTVIISDGAYGINGFDGDAKKDDELLTWYADHVALWSSIASSQTTLWFWGTELSWATVHPLIKSFDWIYKGCNVWNKGIGHVAGNVNSKTIKKFPVVTEVCVQYVRKPFFVKNETKVSIQEWMISEWKRTGLTFSILNDICGVKNAATRKYFTSRPEWYLIPYDKFVKVKEYANSFGNKNGKPYFDSEITDLSNETNWEKQQAKFKLPHGWTNVWNENHMMSNERIKTDSKVVHLNQKPLRLIDLLINTSSDVEDFIFDPFGGLMTVPISAYNNQRKCISFERNINYYTQGIERFINHKKRCYHKFMVTSFFMIDSL